jgi:hypothetical protein
MSRLELPNGIKKDGKLYKFAHLEEMTGKQQDYLVNQKYKSQLDHIEPILADLVTKIETAEGEALDLNINKVITEVMQIEDVAFLLVKLREVTFGDRHIFEKKECPHCEKKQDILVYLNELGIIDGDTDIKPVMLPKKKVEAQYKPLNFKGLRSYLLNAKTVIDEVTTSTLSMIVKSIGEDEDITIDKIKALPALDLKEIKLKTPKYNEIDTKITHACTGCGKDFDVDMEVFSSDFLSL